MKLCFIDCETGGIDPCKHALLQISGIIQVLGKERESFSFRIKPFREDIVEKEALEANHLNPEEGVRPREAHIELLKILSKHVDKYNRNDKFFFVAYNSNFDYQFLRKFYEKCQDKFFGSWFWFPHIDVLQIAAIKLMKERQGMKDFKLGTVAKRLGLTFDESLAHSAQYDIEITKQIFDLLYDKTRV